MKYTIEVRKDEDGWHIRGPKGEYAVIPDETLHMVLAEQAEELVYIEEERAKWKSTPDDPDVMPAALDFDRPNNPKPKPTPSRTPSKRVQNGSSLVPPGSYLKEAV